MDKFPPDRIEKIRTALAAAGYVDDPGYGDTLCYAHFDNEGHQDADGCLLPTPGHYDHADLPYRAAECVRSLIRFTGDQYIELGPLSQREEAYEEEINRLLKVLEDAPHDRNCNGAFGRDPLYPCNCWKSRSLKHKPTEEQSHG